MSSAKTAVPRLEIRILGELEVLAEGVKLALPQSKKTRALLGYLLLTGHEHRRDRLCALLWDVADDPRAALRWSLSKLRELVDGPSFKRLGSDREHVSLNTEGLYVDALELPRLIGANIASATPQALAAARVLFRGELLEGIDLADFHGFSAWLLAERTRFREQHRRILGALIEHSGGHPERVLPLIRELVHIDPTDEVARAKLLEVLHATGAIGEAHEQVRANQRLLAATPPHPGSEAKPPAAAPLGSVAAEPALVGRDAELSALSAWLEQPNAKLKAWLIEGEAGMGKSRLLRECERLAQSAGARTVRVRAPDARPGWPYAALQALLAQLEHGAKGPLERLVEASGSPSSANIAPPTAAGTREQLLQAVQAVLERAVTAHAPLVLLLDDVHYLDEASIELLHFCALNLRARRIGFVLSARGGELHDRPSVGRTLRALRREHILEQLQLSALTLEQTQALFNGAAAQELFEWSGGNPLFALLLREQATPNVLPSSIARLVQDRVASLPPEQADVLRWAAVLGAAFRTDVLRQLVGLDEEGFVEALEGLERHGWLSLHTELEAHARFAHQVVQRALYDQLSEPRKRLMHARVAQLLAASNTQPVAHSSALELTALLAHHAVCGGDRALAVHACLAAARRCIRVYAHADAWNLARRGIAQAQHLPEPDQTCLSLELLQLQLHARRPDSPDEVLPELVRLTDSALDLGAVGHAHLGFHLRAYIKWENGDCTDALRYSREVERISRLAGPRERAEALADSARCLAQLERDLSDAEAFVSEAELLADATHPPAGLPLARGMLTFFRGDYPQAEAELERARRLAARAGNRLEEFYALEFCVYLELARERYQEALALCAELSNTAERLREGSEVPFARAMQALVSVLSGFAPTLDTFEREYAQLVAQDAKQRCAFLSAEAAHYAAARGEWPTGLSLARRALTLANAVERSTESALALSVIVRGELATNSPQLTESCAALRACLEKPVSALARTRARAALALTGQERPHGDRDRRTRVRGTRAG